MKSLLSISNIWATPTRWLLPCAILLLQAFPLAHSYRLLNPKSLSNCQLTPLPNILNSVKIRKNSGHKFYPWDLYKNCARPTYSLAFPSWLGIFCHPVRNSQWLCLLYGICTVVIGCGVVDDASVMRIAADGLLGV